MHSMSCLSRPRRMMAAIVAALCLAGSFAAAVADDAGARPPEDPCHPFPQEGC
jgi:hypothetical protein